MSLHEYIMIQEVYNKLKDEIYDNPNCSMVASKILIEVVNELHNILIEAKESLKCQ